MLRSSSRDEVDRVLEELSKIAKNKLAAIDALNLAIEIDKESTRFSA